MKPPRSLLRGINETARRADYGKTRRGSPLAPVWLKISVVSTPLKHLNISARVSHEFNAFL